MKRVVPIGSNGHFDRNQRVGLPDPRMSAPMRASSIALARPMPRPAPVSADTAGSASRPRQPREAIGAPFFAADASCHRTTSACRATESNGILPAFNGARAPATPARQNWWQLREWCGRMGYPVVREYVEHEDGGKGAEYRQQLDAMFTGASQREFDLLLVWSLDRFSREGMAATVSHLQRLASHGVAFRSFTEEHLSTENELVRNILLAVLSSLAKLEREKISQRTKAGLERARAEGKILGRPKFSDDDRAKLRRSLDTGQSWHAVSKKTRIPYATVKKHARAMGYEPRQRLNKGKAAVAEQPKTNFSGLPTLHEVLAQLRADQNDGSKTR